MIFTSQPPTEPGDFAWKYDEELPIYDLRKVEFWNGMLAVRIGNDTFTVTECGGLWCRLVPLDEYVEKGEVEKAFREGWVAAKYAERLDHITKDGAYAESRAKRITEGGE